MDDDVTGTVIQFTNEMEQCEGRRLGRMPLKTTRKALQFSDFFKFIDLPAQVDYWSKKTPLEKRTFGNDQVGDCTRAKQAYAITRMERLEQKRTVKITDEEVIRVYADMSNRLYGGGDNGAFEDDALNDWRNPETTIRDTSGHPYTIDAYLRINALNPQEVKAALALSGARGIAVCFNLPIAAQEMKEWDVPEGQALINKWMPGTWGGHSMWMLNDYTGTNCYVDDTWMFGVRPVTWRFIAAYMDEAHLVIDSVDAWRRRVDPPKLRAAIGDVIDAVNSISDIKIVA